MNKCNILCIEVLKKKISKLQKPTNLNQINKSLGFPRKLVGLVGFGVHILLVDLVNNFDM